MNGTVCLCLLCSGLRVCPTINTPQLEPSSPLEQAEPDAVVAAPGSQGQGAAHPKPGEAGYDNLRDTTFSSLEALCLSAADTPDVDEAHARPVTAATVVRIWSSDEIATTANPKATGRPLTSMLRRSPIISCCRITLPSS